MAREPRSEQRGVEQDAKIATVIFGIFMIWFAALPLLAYTLAHTIHWFVVIVISVLSVGIFTVFVQSVLQKVLYWIEVMTTMLKLKSGDTTVDNNSNNNTEKKKEKKKHK
jgi:VIT1/CCC1 family predicted Fe2+/Mn2+ transporter